MNKIRVFISSVQKEFAKEQQMLFDYLMSDPLLGLFFDPFVFERMPAVDHSVQNVYLKEVEQCDKLITPFYKDFQDNTDELFSSFTTKELNILEKYFQNALEIMDRKIEKIK